MAPFRVLFTVETPAGRGNFTVLVPDNWAPIGAARFKEMVESKFFDDTRFYRVVPDFMVQFGLSGDPKLSAEWKSKPIMDEPVKQKNVRGYISFAKSGAPNSRSSQIFINYGDNTRLDAMGFSPFAQVEGDGMTVVDSIFNCGEKPDQGRVREEGNAYLNREFGQLSKIISACVID